MTDPGVVLGHPIVLAAARILALALLAAVVTAAVSFFYRIRTNQLFPEGATVLVGLGVVALVLNTRLVLVQFIGETADPLTALEAGINVAVFIVAGAASYGGRRAGDRLGTSERIKGGRLQPDFSPLVRAVGRYITVTLPEEIEDIEGYDPVDPATKKTLAEKRLDFPRGLTVAELRTQLTARLREEYDVGYVDVELAEDGTVEYLAVGQRAAGIGPTLPPQSAAVAVRADPPFSATAGDTVQLWRVEEGTETLVGRAELRASVGGVVTVVTSESIARAVDPTVEYRLMTLSADAHPEREFAAMLRREDETMSVVELAAESPLVGNTIGSLAVTVIAVRAAGGDIETIPERDRVLEAGDTLFALGRPDILRRLETSRDASPGTVQLPVATIDWTGNEPDGEALPSDPTDGTNPGRDGTAGQDDGTRSRDS